MVRTILLALCLLACASPAWALFGRTSEDLRAVADRLQYQFGEDHKNIVPILVATPQAHWQESQADFAAAMLETLHRVFPNTGELIPCPACFQSRVYVSHDGRTVIENGELTLADLARLRENPAYAAAKSVLVTRETPGGIEVRLLAADDGRILYTGLADSTRSLDQAEPPLRLAREMDRRERGEALTYVNVDLGIYPRGTFELKFLEQWGSRNQNLSGLALSAFNPTGAIGAVYMYMLPGRRRVTLGFEGFYSLKGMFSAGNADFGSALTGKVSLNYAISGSYGVFASADTSGVISVGFSLLNPVLFPFLL